MDTNRPTIETICRNELWFIRRVLLQHKVPVADVDDVIQGLLWSVHRSLPTYDPSSASLHTWLFCIARRAATAHVRKVKAQASVSAGAVSLFSAGGASYAEAVADPTPGGEERLIEDEQRKFLYEVLGRMPPERRETFELHAFGGMSDAEVANLLDVPKNTVKSRVAQARRQIEACATKLRERESRRTVGVLPFSVADLIERERARVTLVSDRVRDRIWRRISRAHTSQAFEKHAPPELAEARVRAASFRSIGSRTMRLLPQRVPLHFALALSFGAAVTGGMVAAAVVWTATQAAAPGPSVDHDAPAAVAPSGIDPSASPRAPSLPEDLPSQPQRLELAPSATRPTLMLDEPRKEPLRRLTSDGSEPGRTRDLNPRGATLKAHAPDNFIRGQFIRRDSFTRTNLER